MATTPTTPTTPAGTTGSTPTEPAVTMLPKPTATPVDPPLVFYSLNWRVAPLLVHTQEEADAMDPAEWTQIPPPAGTKQAPPKQEFPKLYANVNLPPKIVGTADDAKALGPEWQNFPIPQDLATAAQKTLDNAKSQSQTQQSGSSGQQAQTQPSSQSGQ